MNNTFPHANALEEAKRMGYSMHDSLDLLMNDKPLEIESYDDAIKSLETHSRTIAGQFLSVLDMYRGS